MRDVNAIIKRIIIRAANLFLLYKKYKPPVIIPTPKMVSGMLFSSTE
jgi:hypothetical protein